MAHPSNWNTYGDGTRDFGMRSVLSLLSLIEDPPVQQSSADDLWGRIRFEVKTEVANALQELNLSSIPGALETDIQHSIRVLQTKYENMQAQLNEFQHAAQELHILQKQYAENMEEVHNLKEMLKKEENMFGVSTARSSDNSPATHTLDEMPVEIKNEEAVVDNSPTVHTLDEIPMEIMSIPPSVYSSVAFLPVLIDPPRNVMEWILYRGKDYLRLCANYTIQGVFIYMLSRMTYWDCQYTHSHTACYYLYDILLIPCLFIFIISVLGDFKETIDMSAIIWLHLPTTSGLTRRIRFQDTPEGGNKYVREEGRGMSRSRKLVVTIFVLWPKGMFALSLLFVGVFFLGTSLSNADLLLNALACEFVLGIDEMIFRSFTPQPVQRLIEEVPPFEHILTDYAKHWQDLWPEVKLGVTILMIVVCYWNIPRCEIWDSEAWDHPPWEMTKYLTWFGTSNPQPPVQTSPDWCSLHPHDCDLS